MNLELHLRKRQKKQSSSINSPSFRRISNYIAVSSKLDKNKKKTLLQKHLNQKQNQKTLRFKNKHQAHYLHLTNLDNNSTNNIQSNNSNSLDPNERSTNNNTTQNNPQKVENQQKPLVRQNNQNFTSNNQNFTRNNQNFTTSNEKSVQSNNNTGLIVGIVFGLLIVIGIIIAVVVYYRRKKNYEEYSRQPQQNIKKPTYNVFQKMKIKDLKFELFENQREQLKQQKKQDINQKEKKLQKQIKVIPKKNQKFNTQIKNHAQGFYQQINLKDDKDKYWYNLKFNKVIQQNSYFQIQILTQKSQIAIGYIHEDSFKKTLANYKKNCKFSIFGVAINTNGIVQHFGKQRCQFKFQCDYGDVLGIAITKETIPKQQIRVWFTLNGKLQNQSLHEQKEKWQDINLKQIKQEPNDGFIVSKIKKVVAYFVPKPQILIQKETKTKQDRMNQDKELQKKKITLSESDFRYIPMIAISKSASFNINFGGENFRFQQPEFKKGLLY